jgi:hypothetical protein
MNISSTQEPDQKLAVFFKQLDRIELIKHEKNFFSLGARGHFENPTSDLLAFFFNPAEEHGLGSVFLDSLVACLEPSAFTNTYSAQSFSSIQREVQTEDGKFIDFVVEGGSWLLVIENKIYSGPENPFSSYEVYATKILRERALCYILLSPGGAETSKKEWLPVRYRSFVKKVKERMAGHQWSRPVSKWQVFAREFILHVEELINYHDMKPEDFQFALGHLAHIRKTKELESDFLNELKLRLLTTMGNAGARGPTVNQHFGWSGNTQTWVFRCGSVAWGQSNIALYPVIESEVVKFGIHLYGHNLSTEKKKRTHDQLQGLKSWQESGEAWLAWSPTIPCDSLDGALKVLERFTNVMADIYTQDETASEDT